MLNSRAASAVAQQQMPPPPGVWTSSSVAFLPHGRTWLFCEISETLMRQEHILQRTKGCTLSSARMIGRLLLSCAFVSALSVSSFAQHPSQTLDSDGTQTATVASTPPETRAAP